ncbi:MAG TPA: hypothetical protein DGL25_00195 [Dehalococcoidia bacterium]|nr:hypothetical protein [Dehalococcoidia bacterium]
MADRIDREIEEILTRLGEKPPTGGEEPISIKRRRRVRGAPPLSRIAKASGFSFIKVSPSSILFAGAGIMVVGLILSAIWSPFIWLAFTGVVLFAVAFISSFLRPQRVAMKQAPSKGAHWRGRYVEYEPAPPGILARIKRAIRGR